MKPNIAISLTQTMINRMAIRKPQPISFLICTYLPLSPQRTRRVRKIIYHPANAILQDLDIEVDQQAYRSAELTAKPCSQKVSDRRATEPDELAPGDQQP